MNGSKSKAGTALAWIGLSSIYLPLKKAVSDAKVLTGRQRPLEGVWVLLAEIECGDGARGLGFSYALRSGGAGQFAHAAEVAPALLGEDADDIGRLWNKLVWLGASAGRSGIALQGIAALDAALWDLKSKRAGRSLAKFLGAYRESVPCYNTSGGYLQSPVEEILSTAEASLSRGLGGIKVKVGQPDWRLDLARVEAIRKGLGDELPLMVDANQQWDRRTALMMGRALEDYRLEWIEEPLDAYDIEGHAALAAALDTPVGSGEMLTSLAEHRSLIEARAVDLLMPDAPRIGGITPFLKLMGLAEAGRFRIAPHFVMELHIQLAAAYPEETWVEHFEWLEPLFNERLEIRGGRMFVPDRPGLGLSLSEEAGGWTRQRFEAGRSPSL